MNKNIILSFLKEHKNEFYKKYDITKIGLFGSYAKNEQKEDSDIDILVDMPSSFDKYYSFREFLENAFGKKIDLGLEGSMRKFIKNQIDQDIIYVK